MTVVKLVIASPIGPLELEADADSLVAIRFGAAEPAEVPPHTGLFAEAALQLDEYFAGRRRRFDLPLAMRGTEFQIAVWRALQTIPYGETWSYAELARRIGRPSAVRAVGAANGANPLPIVVPCHRVIGSSGSLVGFGGGLETKRRLLALEGRISQPLPIAE
jgi:methylated-DNA-[protein]-cysteine S-methyltransferase